MENFFSKTLFKIDGLTFSVLGVLALLLVIWFLFLKPK